MKRKYYYQQFIRNKENISIFLIILYLFLLCGILLSSCHIKGFDQKITSVISESPTLITLEETSMSINVSPSSTEILKLTPTNKAMTKTIVSSELSDKQKEKFFDLFTTNGNCDFPCWWGIQPGDPIQKVFDLAPTVGDSLYGEGKPDYYYLLSLDNLNILDVSIRFFTDKNKDTIRRMKIILNRPVRFRDYYDSFEKGLSISGVMQKYGEPEEILINIYPRAEKDSSIAYSLLLSYQSSRFSILYLGKIEHEDPLQICSTKLTDLEQQLFYLEMHVDTFDVIEHENSLLVKEGYQTLESSASMNKNEFYRTFLKPDDSQCMTITYELWQ
jgi:hypothetical protein